MKEVYFSIDVEADGVVPGLNSMLSIGAVAIDQNGDPIDEFYITIKPIEGTNPNPATMQFWEGYPEAYKKATENAVDAITAMTEFELWVNSHGAKKNVFVGYPAAFDFGFINYYFMRFLGRNPFNFNVIDIRSFAMGVLGTDFSDSALSRLPDKWQSKLPHTHVAIDDAREQGETFSAILKAQKESDSVRRIAMHKMEEIVETGKIRLDTAAALALRIRNFYGTKPIKKIVYR